MIKLDLSGGEFPLGKGYLNVDIRGLPTVDIIADIMYLPFKDNVVDEIFSRGTLEHFNLSEATEVLKEFYRVLKPNKSASIGVPSLDALCNDVIKGTVDFKLLNQYFYGAQQNPFDLHKSVYNFANLKVILKKVGFRYVTEEPYDMGFHIKDYMLKVVCWKVEKEILEWTGERYLPFVDPKMCGAEIHYEHLHRYLFASHFVESKNVLDLACGEGYGSYILSKSAEHVLGIDIYETAILHASSKYIQDNLEFIHGSDNLEFIHGSILEVPEGEKVFDVTVCFEILEHVKEHNELIEEVKRLLKDDGIFVVSTPNKKVYSDNVDYKNPFHEKELYFREFKELLKKNFKNVHFFGQKVYAGSHLWSLNQGNKICEELVVEKSENGFSVTDYEKKEPMYFIAIASDKEVDISKLALRSYLTDVDDTVFDVFRAHIENIEREKDARIAQLQEEINKMLQLKSVRLHQKLENVLGKTRIRR